MATGNLAPCLSEVLRHEGGYTRDRRDPGNWTGGKVGKGELRGTNKGIAASTHPQLDIKNLSDEQIASVYRFEYWAPIRGEALPLGADLAVFDYAVNSGVGRAGKEAQRAAGMPAAQQDGAIGNNTLAAIDVMKPAAFVKALCARRMSFLRSLRIWETFGKGWSRRVASVEATALSWLLTKPELEAERKEASRTAAGQATGGAATGAGGVAVDQSPDMAGWPWWLILALALAIAAPLLIRAIVNLQRARALAAVIRPGA